MCTRDSHETLANWRNGLTYREAAELKVYAMSSGFEDKILCELTFEEVKSVVIRFRDILFDERAVDRWRPYMTTPPGDEARTDMYDKVVRAFDNGIDELALV